MSNLVSPRIVSQHWCPMVFDKTLASDSKSEDPSIESSKLILAQATTQPAPVPEYRDPVAKPPAPRQYLQEEAPFRRQGWGKADGFKRGNQPLGPVDWMPPDPPAPGAPPAAPVDANAPRPGYSPTPVIDAQRIQDPNRNGPKDPNEPLWPGATTLTKVADRDRVPAEIFWRDQDKLVDSTGKKLGHVTFRTDAVLIAGGTVGMLTSLGAYGTSIYAKNILRDGKVEYETNGLPKAEGRVLTAKQQWAHDWQTNWNPVGRTDLVHKNIVAELKATSEAAATEATMMDKINSSYGTMARNTSIENAPRNVADYLDKVNAGRDVKLTLDSQEFGQLIARETTRTQAAAETASKELFKGNATHELAVKEEKLLLKFPFAKAAGVVALGMVGNHYLDRYLNDRDHKNSLATVAGAASVPLTFVTSPLKSWDVRPVVKFGATATLALGLGGASYLAGRYIEDHVPSLAPIKNEGALTTNKFGPNMVDIVGMGAAAALPAAPLNNAFKFGGTIPDTYSSRLAGRMNLIGGAYLQARSLGSDDVLSKVGFSGAALASGLFVKEGLRKPVIATQIALTGLSLADTLIRPKVDFEAQNKEAWAQMKTDQTQKTWSSMSASMDMFARNAIDNPGDTNLLKFMAETKNTVGDKDGPLFQYYDQWNKKTTPYPKADEGGDLMRYRGAVILGTALGESRLHYGSARKSPNSYNLNYIPGMEGRDLDIGGYAAAYLETSKWNASQAVTETQRLATLKGEPVKQDEIDAYTKAKERIDQSLAKIYGKHDLTGAVNALADYAQNDTEGLAKWGNHIKTERIGALLKQQWEQDPVGRAAMAKHLRDLATIQLAQVDKSLAQQSAGDAYKMLTDREAGVQKAILEAIRLAKNNPDNAELIDLYNRRVAASRGMAYKDIQQKDFANAWMIDPKAILGQ